MRRENNENGSTKLLKRLIGAHTMHFRAVLLNKTSPNDANCMSAPKTEENNEREITISRNFIKNYSKQPVNSGNDDCTFCQYCTLTVLSRNSL